MPSSSSHVYIDGRFNYRSRLTLMGIIFLHQLFVTIISVLAFFSNHLLQPVQARIRLTQKEGNNGKKKDDETCH